MSLKNLLLKVFLIAILLLYGCSSQLKEISNFGQPNSSLKGEILQWVEIPFGLTKEQSVQLQTIITGSIQDFMKLNSNVKIVIEFVPSDETLSKLNKQITRGAGPDLFAVSLLRKQIPLLIRSGYLKRLDEDNLDLSQFRPEAIKQLRYQEHLYALPVNLGTQVLCYNKSKIEEIPKTLDDLIDQARRGYSVGLQSSFREAFWGTGAFGGKLIDESGDIVLAKNQGWVQWIQWLRKADSEPNFFLIEDAETLQKTFVEEKLSYITCLSDWIPSLTEGLGNNKLGVTLLPGQENQPATPPLWTVGFIFNRASSANQHQLALKLAQFLSNAQSQQRVQVQVPFLIPVNKNVMVDFRLFPMQAVLVEQSKTGVIISLDQIDKNQAFLEYGDIIYHKVLGGEITAEEAALQITKVINNQFN